MLLYLKQAQLFYQSPETIEKNIKELVKKFEQNGVLFVFVDDAVANSVYIIDYVDALFYSIL